MTYCYLSLGSNLKTPVRQLRQAMIAIRTLPRTALIQCSKIYITTPQGVRGQPLYRNMVIAIKTTLSAPILLSYCQSIEANQGRTRKVRWSSRTIDIDILLYGHQVIHTNKLHVPHPRMFLREFVMTPLLEIYSSHPLVHPLYLNLPHREGSQSCTNAFCTPLT